VRRHAKAAILGSTLGSDARRVLFGRVSGAADGSGRPSGQLLLLAALVSAFLLVPAAIASAVEITVHLEGSGTGTVKSADWGIECSNTPGQEKLTPADCSADIPPFTFVPFSASPDFRSLIGTWSGVNTFECDSKPSCQGLTLFEPEELQVEFQALPDPPVVDSGVASNVSASGATLEGTVNPNSTDFPIQECFYEIGATTSYGRNEECQPSSIPAGTSAVPVSARFGLLAPGTTYHYRLVTSNAGGFARGGDRTFTTSPGTGEPCPNASIRIQQGATFLPDCRAFEMVSPPFKNSQPADLSPTVSQVLSPDGNTASWTSKGVFADALASSNGSSYVSKRTGSGWKTFSTLPPFSLAATGGGPSSPPTLASADLSRAVNCGKVVPATRFNEIDSISTFTCAIWSPESGWAAMPSFAPYNKGANLTGFNALFLGEGGASADLSTIVFSGRGYRFLPGDTATGENPTLYSISGLGGPSPKLALVNVDNGGNLIGPSSTPSVGGSQSKYLAVSSAGSTIYFTATPTGGVPTLYARTEAFAGGTPGSPVTVAISDPSPAECGSCDPTVQPGEFVGASEDGSRAYFTTEQQLVDADTDSTADLYRYDFDAPAGHRLVQVSAGGSGDLTPGSGAEVVGVLQTDRNADTAYFIAKGLLTTFPNTLGQTAEAGAFNLYRVERSAANPTGRTSFVAKVSPSDEHSLTASDGPSQTTPDGRYLVFSTRAALAPDDLDSAADVYRYDAATGSLVRISIANPADPGSNNGNTEGMDATIAGPYRGSGLPGSTGQAVSDDGSYVAFATAEQLQSSDLNTKRDAYVWHDGTVGLVSDGQESGGAFKAALTPSGSEVMFVTPAQILPQDTDDLEDVYVARIDGGFPYVPPAPSCDTNEACRGSAPPPPAASSTGSATFSGPGNEKSSAKHRKKHRKKNRKHRARRHHAHKKQTTTRSHG
jgi:hypothetical protein